MYVHVGCACVWLCTHVCVHVFGSQRLIPSICLSYAPLNWFSFCLFTYFGCHFCKCSCMCASVQASVNSGYKLLQFQGLWYLFCGHCTHMAYTHRNTYIHINFKNKSRLKTIFYYSLRVSYNEFWSYSFSLLPLTPLKANPTTSQPPAPHLESQVL